MTVPELPERDAQRANMRRLLRRRRADLSPDEVASASMAVVGRLTQIPVVRHATTVAGYRAVRGEINVDEFLASVTARGAVVTVPRVEGTALTMMRWAADTPSATGAFGIDEPLVGEAVPFGDHDAIVVPLVAFDDRGGRLGQGGGFYDRAIAAAPSRPLLIGVAHAFQQVPAVPLEAWDQRLDAVVTDEAVFEFRPGVLGHPGS